MFDFDAGKLVVFGIVALAVIPPKELPRVMRTVGKYVGQMRRMASDFQGQFMEAMKESVKQEIAAINAETSKLGTSFDPSNLMRDNLPKPAEASSPKESEFHESLTHETTPEPPPHEPSLYETVKAEPPTIAPPEHAPTAPSAT